jgi:hypothetical protein
MERFAEAIVAGGIALVGGLWLLEVGPDGPVRWIGGLALAVAGLGATGAGIWLEVDV